MARVVCNGVFDVLQTGHFNLLMFARGQADNFGMKGKVIVLLDEDEKVMADKGLQRPIYDVHERAKAILDLRMPDGSHVVDEVEFFSTNLHLEMMLKRIMPDVIIKGSDWKGRTVIGANIARVVFFDRLGEYSTTDVIQRCQAKIIVK
jgi:cytidyltransferase-like protein